MPILNNIQAELVGNGPQLKEFNDPLLSYDPSENSKNRITTYFLDSGKTTFSLRIRAFPEIDIRSPFLMCVIGMGGNDSECKKICFRSWRTTGLVLARDFTYVREKDPNIEIPYTETGAKLQLKLGTVVEVSFYRVGFKAPRIHKYPIPKKMQDSYLPGQVVLRKTITNKEGYHRVTEAKDKMEWVHLVDKLTRPMATFRWVIKSSEELQTELLIPRPVFRPDFQLCVDPKLLHKPDMETPISNENLIEGLILKDLDGLAWDYLLHNLECPRPREELNVRALRVLVCSSDSKSFTKNALRTTDGPILHNLGTEELEKLLPEPLEICKEIRENSTMANIYTHAQLQSGLPMEEVQTRFSGPQLEILAAKFQIEQRYLAAMLQVIRVLAEKRLSFLKTREQLQLQQRPRE